MSNINNESLNEFFEGTKLLAILRGFGVEKSVALAEQAWALGIHCVEVTIQSSTDLDALRAVVEAGALADKLVGAGTVISLEHVRQAKNSGAAFTVSPTFDPDVSRASYEAGMPPLPGVATPSEIQAATKFGLTWLKAFPAATLGPSWFGMMAGPFPEARFVASGGMDASNAELYLTGGARVVGVGSALADPTQLQKLETIAHS